MPCQRCARRLDSVLGEVAAKENCPSATAGLMTQTRLIALKRNDGWRPPHMHPLTHCISCPTVAFLPTGQDYDFLRSNIPAFLWGFERDPRTRTSRRRPVLWSGLAILTQRAASERSGLTGRTLSVERIPNRQMITLLATVPVAPSRALIRPSSVLSRMSVFVVAAKRYSSAFG